ncbi:MULTISPECIES: hypothetical protein [Streptosporangium]|uniref:DUF485 domain-containing protein n=1 Tax=Streptosporangium brasiliense TaxID=47480 RepID=A0ABT9RCP1_9ACTN|nr:hypothetical protein [Streptosporangium brasiliense]MDP9867024.1 hypothetical protein [Streptosporangium brasiliense]
MSREGGEPEPREEAEPRRRMADRLARAVERPRRDADRPDRPRRDADRPDRPRREVERLARALERPRRETDRPRREVVTSPRTTAARHPRYPVTREIDEQTRLGEVYMRSLIRTQFRLALFVCTVLGCVVGGLPMLFLLVPELREVQLLGIPLPWAVLAGLIYPAFVIGAWLYVRQAERNERHFAELVERAR